MIFKNLDLYTYIIIQGSVELFVNRPIEGQNIEYIVSSKYDGDFFGNKSNL